MAPPPSIRHSAPAWTARPRSPGSPRRPSRSHWTSWSRPGSASMTDTLARATTTGAQSTAGLHRAMRPRQLVMMSLGGAIGAGLFVGSGAGIAVAGPAILISFLVAAVLVVFVMRMMGEMAAAHPASGAFAEHRANALGPVAGRTIGWLYWVQVIIVIAAEATGAAAITAVALPGIPQWASALFYMVVLTGVNLVGVRRFGEVEFWFAAIKIVAILGFLVIGVAMRSEEHTSELQSRENLVCRLLLEKKKNTKRDRGEG